MATSKSKTPKALPASTTADELPDEAKRLVPLVSMGTEIRRVHDHVEDMARQMRYNLMNGRWTAAQLAEVYHMLRLMDQLHEQMGKVIGGLLGRLASGDDSMMVVAFDNEKITSFTTTYGYRVGLSEVMRASIKTSKDESEKMALRHGAYQWLRDNGLDAIITETVNSSTLSATARELLEDGKELDDRYFNTVVMKQPSWTKVKK